MNNFAHTQQLCLEMPLMVHGEAVHKILLKFDIPNFSRQQSDRFILKKTKICWRNATEIQIFRTMNDFVSSKADWENKRVACTKRWNARMPERQNAGTLKPGPQNY